MLFTLLQALAAPVPVAPPAPPSPPSFRLPRMAPTQVGDLSAPDRRIPVDVTVRSADAVLWTGSLTVGGRGQSSGWTQARTEPLDPACAVRGAYGLGERDALNLQLSLVGGGDDPTVRISVTARWSRPAETGCGGSRTVELRQIAVLADRTPVRITGDGGLVVELRRR